MPIVESVKARLIEAGDIIMFQGCWMFVQKSYKRSRSCYNKVNLVPEHNRKAIPLYTTLYLDSAYMRKVPLKEADTKHVHLCACVEEMVVLKAAMDKYDEANDLPEEITIPGTSFTISANHVRRDLHEEMMASFNRLKNEIAMIKKP